MAALTVVEPMSMPSVFRSVIKHTFSSIIKFFYKEQVGKPAAMSAKITCYYSMFLLEKQEREAVK